MLTAFSLLAILVSLNGFTPVMNAIQSPPMVNGDSTQAEASEHSLSADSSKKETSRAYHRAKYLKNKTKILAQHKERYIKNRRRILDKNLEYQAAHKVERRTRMKRWYANNKTQILNRLNAWRINNKPKRQAILARYYRKHKVEINRKAEAHNAVRRARKLATTVDQRGISDFMAKVRKMRKIACHWCGVTISGKDVQFDHIIPLAKAGEHSLSNLCAACQPCNSSKNSKLIGDWQPPTNQPVLSL